MSIILGYSFHTKRTKGENLSKQTLRMCCRQVCIAEKNIVLEGKGKTLNEKASVPTENS